MSKWTDHVICKIYARKEGGNVTHCSKIRKWCTIPYYLPKRPHSASIHEGPFGKNVKKKFNLTFETFHNWHFSWHYYSPPWARKMMLPFGNVISVVKVMVINTIWTFWPNDFFVLLRRQQRRVWTEKKLLEFSKGPEVNYNNMS